MQSITLKLQTVAFILVGIALASCNSRSQSDQTKEQISKMSSNSPQVQGEAVGIKVRKKQPYGSYLADGKGMSLYLFLKDSRMHRGDPNGKSRCYDKCAENWPPLLASKGNIKAGARVDTTLLETTKRKDGTLQVSYNGYPLYYYVDDKNPGDVTGQDKKEYGAEWYLVKPNGEKMGDIEEK